MIALETMIDAIMKYDVLSKHGREGATVFVNRMVRDNKVIIEEEAFAFYVKVDDKTLDDIAKDPGYITKPINILRMLESKGDNVHFFGIISIKTNGIAIRSILRGIKDTIEKEHPKTISWWNKDMNKFITRRF